MNVFSCKESLPFDADKETINENLDRTHLSIINFIAAQAKLFSFKTLLSCLKGKVMIWN